MPKTKPGQKANTLVLIFCPGFEQQAEFNSKQGLTIDPNQGQGDELDIDEALEEDKKSEQKQDKPENNDSIEEKSDKELEKLEGQIKTYYQRILFFSFLTKDKVASLDDILSVIERDENISLSKNLFLDKAIIQKISKSMDPFKRSRLDYKIQNISMLACDESIEPIERAMTSIKKFNRMSESEVITPSKVCDEMVGLLPEEGLKEIVSNQDKLLDIASKSGEYAVALYKRLTSELGYSHENVKDIIYSIPTSSIAYAFTRRFYEILDLNVENIAAMFNAYDLIKVKNDKDEVDYEKISGILKQNKKFSNITLQDEVKAGDKKVNFGAIIGNPPYQKIISKEKSNSSLSKQLFPYYTILSMKISSNLSSLIIPARWFTGDAQDKSFLKLREFLKDENTLSDLYYYEDTNSIFHHVEIKGGICHFLSSSNHIGDINFVKVLEGEKISTKRNLFLKGLDIVLTDEIQFSVLNKVRDEEFSSLTEITTGRNAFGITGKESIVKTVSSVDIFENACELRCKHNLVRYITEDKVTKNIDIFNSYKVFISKSAGAPNTDKKVIGEPYIGGLKSACTDSLIPIGKFDNLFEAESLQKYLKTKFSRYMISLVKSSQNTTQIVYRFVPMQDFTEKSDIDWTKSIVEIDEQLFDKYNLSTEERQHIKKSIKNM
ncbi:Eco57I restriction-modification methylase domain-containing protein [Mesomycoplasma ovipneumoniae]|uniref:Eco57I restriction-modification methylase domain-containing protein n=1 Tax=Mesomycoplasma ovipneumoniae TaxID=29562 RepID=UPI0021616BE7|nr:Eco57I restriction-modification methylase domain-containing protein [Mesomycoplasma ovipneumoniae]UVO15149.1 Eco57I restriction-modification methylase domain-containing protein [Mesomycoplasma ovipneumoniae]